MAKPKEQSKVLAEFQRVDGIVRLKVGVTQKGEPYIDLRQYWQPPDTDEWAPTRKGVRLHGEMLEQLVAALGKADKELDKLYK